MELMLRKRVSSFAGKNGFNFILTERTNFFQFQIFGPIANTFHCLYYTPLYHKSYARNFYHAWSFGNSFACS
jgi:hypothetical protein